jgi:hypothetical protein
MRVLTALFAALCIAGFAEPSQAQYYCNPYAQAPPSYGDYTTPNGWGERGSNGWTYHSNDGGFDVGRDSNGCIYTANWSNC